MSIGQFAGSFAEAFLNAKNSKADRKLREDIAKLQGKLVEAQLKTAEGQQLAKQQVESLMNTGIQQDTSGRAIKPDFDMPAEGELGEIGGVQQPMSLLDMLSGEDPRAPAAQQGLLGSGMLGAGDLLDFEQTKMIQEGVPDFSQFFDSMGGGLGPDSAYIPIPSVGPSGPSITFQPNPDYRTSVDRGETQVDAKVAFRDVVKAIDILGELEGTHLQSGSPAGEGLRKFGELGSSFGLPFFTEEEQEKLRDKRGELKKLIATFQITSEERKALTETARGLAVLELVGSATADLQNGAIPNTKILLNMLEAKVEASRILGEPLPNEAEILQYIDEVRPIVESGVMPGAARPAISQEELGASITPDMVMQMTLEQLKLIGESGMQLSQDAKRAAADRWEELKNAD
jgi:hypothetical protein